ncbi:hypothetical protein FDO65_20205, partial [Nakamurella flava]
SPFAGTVARLVAQPGDTIAVGAPIAYLLSESDDLMAGLFDDPPPSSNGTGGPNGSAAEPAVPGSDVPADLPAEPVGAAASNGRGLLDATPVSRRGPIPTVPLARRRAAELRVKLETVTATRADGVITVEDVENAARATAAAPAPVTAPAPVVPVPAPAPPAPVRAAAPPAPPAPAAHPVPAAPTGTDSNGAVDPGFADALAARRRSIRSAVARTMTSSAAVPQFTVFAELDLDNAARARGRIGWTTLLLRALSRALRDNPHVNAGWDEQAGAPAAPHTNVGVALAVDSAVGLLAPVVRDPDLLPIDEQDQLVRATINRARTGALTGADIKGGTTTLSNLGGFGVPYFTSLLTPPQATALSIGAITERPVVHRGGLTVRLGATVGLTLDHRPVDGADGAKVLAEIGELFRNPDRLLD